MASKHCLIFSILLLGYFAALSQTRAIDSLESKLSNSSGTKKVDLINQLIYEFINRDSAKVQFYFAQSLALSKEYKYRKGFGRAYTYKGVASYLLGEFPVARFYLRKGINYSDPQTDKQNLGYALMQMGNSFLNQTEFDSALLFFEKSYQVLKDSADPSSLSKLYRSLYSIYYTRSQKELARKYLYRCLRVREKMNNKRYLADAIILVASFNIDENDFISAQSNLNRARAILNTVKSESWETISDWQFQQGRVYIHNRNYDKALTLFDSASNYFSKNNILTNYVRLQAALGKIFNDRGEYEIALKCLGDALKIAELKKITPELCEINIQMGWANFNLGDVKQSKKFANIALQWIGGENLPTLEVDALTLKAISSSYLKEFDEANLCLNQALKIRQKLGDNDDIAQVYYNLGFMETEKQDFKKALSHFLLSYTMLKNSKNDIYLSWCLSGLGRTYLKTGDLSNAELYLNLAQSKARSMNLKELVLILYLAQQELFEAKHNSDEALHFSKLAYALQDSLHRSDVGKRFAALQHSDEITLLDKSIKTLKEEKDLASERIVFQTRLIILFIVLALIIGVVAVQYARFYRRLKRLHGALNKQKEELESQANYISQLNRSLEGMVAQKTLDLQQTNQELMKQNNDLLQFSYTVSHNLRGPVARLLGLTNIIQYSNSIDDQNKMVDYIRKASSDLDNTLGDLSKIIDIKNDLHKNNEWVSLEEEWLKSQSLLSDVVKEDFLISADFEKADKLFTIRAFIQSLFYNLISNAIKYRSEERKLKLVARSHIEKGKMVIEIEDNGVGMDIDKHKDSIFKLFKRFHNHVEGRGLGLYLIKSQIDALNGTIDVYSKIDEGTLFRIILPNSSG